MTLTTTSSRPATEERIVLTDSKWGTYERLLADHADRGAPRFTYDHGTLEIVSPFLEHGLYSRAADWLLGDLSVALGINVAVLGSTTFHLAELERGFEADSCYYIQNEWLVRGKRTIDPAVDPPPDIILEIDISRSSVPKLSIFEEFRVPEVWRYDGERFDILLLSDAGYQRATRSAALPMLPAEVVGKLLARAAELAPLEWRREVREWNGGLSGQSGEHRGSGAT